MSYDTYFNNDNLPPGYEDPGEEMIPPRYRDLGESDYDQTEELWEE